MVEWVKTLLHAGLQLVSYWFCVKCFLSSNHTQVINIELLVSLANLTVRELVEPRCEPQMAHAESLFNRKKNHKPWKYLKKQKLSQFYLFWRPPRKSGLTSKTTKARVNHSITSMVFGVNPLFLAGLHLVLIALKLHQKCPNSCIKFNIWRPPSLSELTPMISNMGLTHLGSEASI